MGKIGHMRKSVAFEAFKVQTISVHKVSEIYTIRPPNEVTSSKWKKHLINSLPCVLVIQKELISLKGTTQSRIIVNESIEYRLLVIF